ncbi:GNAT family N-acetyltransferase [Pseudomonas cichorii]|uniref:GNAT family N-acetyltransferase n=1 Tax=Pseudomonas syringae group TaxID=136849 RepID=UPI001910A287|nr:GNAT family N-acetyltransferase [Pseudomonas cichorii]MBX8490698.1 GNAT family N-acetyltransferase [Pseudomonas cichorii]MBX8518151.1 GNAT family N-acetyltransferase [Pseudomonas cichorii]MBX8534935.1 GNAT family N-acetyltransferase [Pseudomonas cichorii]MBX8548497.1 GNAT family N-acetyltransferase [Pseudomonas cichorii]MBX8557772.1 GNAT family N-acetyltransferase [Pseudomonas cichorii]
MNSFVPNPELPRLPRGIREFTENDLEAMMNIFNETAGSGANSPVTRPMTYEEVKFYVNLYKRDGLPVYVYERRGEVLGWLSINRFSWGTQACYRTGETAIYVRGDHFGSGIGVLLCKATVILGQQAGLENLVAWIMAANTPSQKIVTAVGAHLWARLPNIARFGEQRSDVLLFGLPLGQSLNVPVRINVSEAV